MKRLALAAGLVLLATVPFWIGNSYYTNIAAQILLYAVFALGLNVLVGYAGLVSLGHAGLFGIAAYAGALFINAGAGHLLAILGALGVTLVASAAFAVLALRGTGLGFVMITVALGQIVWGVAYRWISITNGDNGVSVATRPAPFGISLRGTRDQPRRMNALGYNVWLIRFLAFLFSGLWSGVAGMLFLYYNQFVSPQVVALTSSAEVLLMVISGGTGTLLGPIAGAALVVIMKNVASAYIERWNFVLGAIFVAIVIFMPEGLVPGSVRFWRWARGWLRPRPSRPVPVIAPAPQPKKRA